MWRKLHGLAKMRFRFGQIIPLFGDLRLFEFVLHRPLARNGPRERFRLLDAAPEDPGSVEIVIEQIVLSFAVMRVERDGLLEGLVGLLRVSNRQKSTVFRAATPRPAQPKVRLRTVGSQLDTFLEEFCRLLVIRHHEVVLTGEEVSGDIRRRIMHQDL